MGSELKPSKNPQGPVQRDSPQPVTALATLQTPFLSQAA